MLPTWKFTVIAFSVVAAILKKQRNNFIKQIQLYAKTVLHSFDLRDKFPI